MKINKLFFSNPIDELTPVVEIKNKAHALKLIGDYSSKIGGSKAYIETLGLHRESLKIVGDLIYLLNFVFPPKKSDYVASEEDLISFEEKINRLEEITYEISQ